MYWKSNQQVNLRLAFPRTVAFGIIISVNILHLAPVTWLGSRCLIGIAEPYAKAELVALAEAKLINQGRHTSLSVRKRTGLPRQMELMPTDQMESTMFSAKRPQS